MDTIEAYKKLNGVICEVIDLFQKSHFFFLTEQDVQAYLYNKLLEKFKTDEKTTPIHCQISSRNNLKGRAFASDISICTPNTFHQRKNGFDIDIELNVEIKYCIDYTKLQIIRKLWNPNTKKQPLGDYYKLCKNKEDYSTILIFDHKNNLKLDDLITIQKNDKDNNIKIVYITTKKVICVMNSKGCELTTLPKN